VAALGEVSKLTPDPDEEIELTKRHVVTADRLRDWLRTGTLIRLAEDEDRFLAGKPTSPRKEGAERIVALTATAFVDAHRNGDKEGMRDIGQALGKAVDFYSKIDEEGVAVAASEDAPQQRSMLNSEEPDERKSNA